VNVQEPPGYEPPSSSQLLRSTLLALALAAVILVAFVLPAEYGIDPTGIGNALGLKRMGDIKQQLADEAHQEAAEEEAIPPQPEPIAEKVEAPAAREPEVSAIEPESPEWRDEMTISIAPDDAVELKLAMKTNERADYEWTTAAGALNFNAHGHGGDESVTYGTGRGVENDEGTLAASFDGHHGWFFRNRTSETVTLTLRTRGQYSELVRTR
jgi:hypothetical protein